MEFFLLGKSGLGVFDLMKQFSGTGKFSSNMEIISLGSQHWGLSVEHFEHFEYHAICSYCRNINAKVTRSPVAMVKW